MRGVGVLFKLYYNFSFLNIYIYIVNIKAHQKLCLFKQFIIQKQFDCHNNKKKTTKIMLIK